MKIEEILDQSEKDLKLDLSDLGRESIRTPEIFHKYMKEYTQMKKKYNQLQNLKRTILKDLFLYYSGKGDANTIKRKGDFDYKILKSDIQIFLDADEEMQEVLTKLNEVEESLESLQKILDQVKDRTWTIKNIVAYMQYTSGVGG